MSNPRIGSLCSGYGGLEVVPQQCALAVRTLLSLDVSGVAA